MSVISKIKNIHFIGIGGISMSSLAKLMLAKGKKISGSDRIYGEELVSLNELGIDVYAGHDVNKLKTADLVVYNSAIPEDDEELAFAKENNIPTVSRSVFLSELCNEYEKIIAVSGTHGKTTVTAMISEIMLTANAEFTAHVGGNVIGRGNMIYKGDKYFVTEACEYKKNFLSLRPDMAVVLNVEYDHPDTYHSPEELYDAFDKFCSSAKSKLIINGDCEYFSLKNINVKNVITYGFGKSNTYYATKLNIYENGCYGFVICKNGIPKDRIVLKVSGLHNVLNALCGYAVCDSMGISKERISEGLNRFKGVAGRYETKGEINGAKVVVDYAHHPTELASTFKNARQQTKGKIIAIFQPHTFSRTSSLMNEFVASLKDVEILYVFKEYSAREKECDGASAKDLFNKLDKIRKDVYYYDEMISLAVQIGKVATKDDIVLILGAGDIVRLADFIVTT